MTVVAVGLCTDYMFNRVVPRGVGKLYAKRATVAYDDVHGLYAFHHISNQTSYYCSLHDQGYKKHERNDETAVDGDSHLQSGQRRQPSPARRGQPGTDGQGSQRYQFHDAVKDFAFYVKFGRRLERQRRCPSMDEHKKKQHVFLWTKPVGSRGAGHGRFRQDNDAGPAQEIVAGHLESWTTGSAAISCLLSIFRKEFDEFTHSSGSSPGGGEMPKLLERSIDLETISLKAESIFDNPVKSEVDFDLDGHQRRMNELMRLAHKFLQKFCRGNQAN